MVRFHSPLFMCDSYHNTSTGTPGFHNLLSQMAPTTRSSKVLKETASAPFGPPFDDADADTLLRSSDQVDFYRVMLSKTSPFFKSMFSLPQPDTSISEKQIPTITLTEDSKTIAVLLASIYPTVPTKSIPLDVMIGALVAARKYDMDVVSRCLVQNFAESEVVRDSPIEAFCAACSHELGEAARVAARASLKHRLNLDIIGGKLPYLNGPGLYQLWKFHRACSATAAKAVSGTHLTWIAHTNRTWWGFVRDQCSQSLRCPKHQYQVGLLRCPWEAPTPWHNYIARARNVLLEHPCREAVADYSVLEPSYQERPCYSCRCSLIVLPEFIRLSGDEVERRVSEVDLDLPF
ncbi:hypothetical protein H4582DRAFT_1938313 [Lactarius indigo]|nr:hypothetical protein H4582DRAFT_1938313 [Lactarius indigo]